METVQQVAQAASQDIAQNNPVPPLAQSQPVVPPVNDLQEWEAKKVREANTSTLDYATAALHQDDFLNGFIANHVGESMAVDPQFNILTPDVWKQMTDDLPESLKPELLNAHSAAHAHYIRGLLHDKMREQAQLGDLGWKGNTLRMIGGFVEPGNLLVMAGSMGLGAVAGGGSALARANKALQLTTEMAEGPAKVAAVAAATRDLEAAAKAASGMRTAAANIGGAAGINAGLEKLRQSYNFEDDTSGVVHAGLMGIILGAPIAGLSARHMARLREVAGEELAVLNAVQAANKHPDVAQPEALTQAKTVDAYHKYVADVVTGEKPYADLKEPPLTADAEMRPAKPHIKLKSSLDQLAEVAGDPPEVHAPEGVKFASVGAAAVAEGTPRFMGIEPTYMRSGRLDIYATLNKNPNPVFQELAHKLVKDAIGSSKTNAQARSASETKRNIQRTLGGFFHTEAAGAYIEAAQARGVRMPRLNRAFADEFYGLVTAVAQGDTNVLAQHADIAPMLQKSAAAMRQSFDRAWARAEKAGVKGTEIVPKIENYVNRIYDYNAMRRLEQAHGEDALVGLMARSRPISTVVAAEAKKLGITAEQLQLNKVREYYRAIKKLEHSHMAQDMALYEHDANSLRQELAHAGLQPDAIDSIVTTMFEEHAKDPTSGNAAQLKFRFDLDPNHAEVMPNGERLRVGDLFENDSRVLMDRYMNSMAGHIGLAEMGIKSRSDFMGWLKEAEGVHTEMRNDPAQYNAHRQLLMDLYDNITGRPMSTQEFNTTARVANALRALTRSTVLGQLGIAAAFEMHKAVVNAGLTAALTQMGTLRSVIRAVAKGHQFDSKLAEDIRHLWGFGSESASAYARQHELTDFTYDRGLTRFENFSNEASHVVDHLSGNSFFTAATREMATRMFIQKFANFAAGRKMSAKMRERMVGQGVDASRIDKMLRDLNQHVERDGDRVVGIRWEDWQQKAPHSFNEFQTVVEREVRDAIQEHDIGETMGFMHTTLGKVFSELRTFMLVGHAKSTLKALHYRDATSLNQLMFGIVSEALAYSLQTSINFAGNKKELERRMQPEYIAGSIFQRMSLFGVTSGIVGTAAEISGHKITGSTANTDNRNFLVPPAMANIQHAMTGVQVAGQALNPFSHTVTTDKELRTALSAFPGGNLWGVRNVNDWLAQQLPKSELKQ